MAVRLVLIAAPTVATVVGHCRHCLEELAGGVEIARCVARAT
jgi:hypothetical protein